MDLLAHLDSVFELKKCCYHTSVEPLVEFDKCSAKVQMPQICLELRWADLMDGLRT